LWVPQPYTGIDFVAGAFTTDWDGDKATWGQATAADNAAYWSQYLRDSYLQWKDRNPRVIVFDTAEIFNPGVTLDPTLHRCDSQYTSCLDTLADPTTFTATISDGVGGAGTALAVSAFAAGSLATSRVITGTGVAAGTYTVSGSGSSWVVNQSQLVASTTMTVLARKLDDSLHTSDLGERLCLEAFSKTFGLWGRRARSSIMGSNVAEPWTSIFTSARWAKMFRYKANTKSGSNMLLTFYPSPEASFYQADPVSRFGSADFPTPSGGWVGAEGALYSSPLASVREMANLKGSAIKLAYISSTGAISAAGIYTATAVSSSSTATNPLGHLVQFNGIDSSAEASSGYVVVWVESEAGLPYSLRRVDTPINGTVGMGHNPYNYLWVPSTFEASRGDGTGTPTIDVYLQTLSDGRFQDTTGSGYTTSGGGASDGLLIGQFTFGSGVRTGTWTANSANISTLVSAGVWTSTIEMKRSPQAYRVRCVASTSLAGVVTIRS
jgi:hypothetical protein